MTHVPLGVINQRERWGKRYMMWVYGGNRSHYATTRTRSAHLHLPKPWSPLSKHHPYKLQPVHTIRLMSERICLSSQLIRAPSCVVKSKWVTISLPAKPPPGDSLGRKHSQYHRPIFGFHWDLWLIAETWIIPDTGWRSEHFSVLLSEYTHTHTHTHTHKRAHMRAHLYIHTHTLWAQVYQHALVSRALAQSSTTQWLNRRYSEERLLYSVGASLYYTIIRLFMQQCPETLNAICEICRFYGYSMTSRAYYSLYMIQLHPLCLNILCHAKTKKYLSH